MILYIAFFYGHMKYTRIIVGQCNNKDKFENPKAVIKSRQSKKNQYNDQQKKDKQYNGKQKKGKQYNGQQKQDKQYNGKQEKDKQWSTKHYIEH